MPLAITGGHAYEICLEVNGADEVRQGVRSLLKDGVDFIKLMASNETPLRDQAEQTVPQFTLEELRAAVEEAHDAQVRVIVHACGTQAIERCLDAGVDAIVHGIYMNREQAHRVREQQVFYIPTLGIYRANSNPKWRRGDAKAAFCRRLVDAHGESFANALEAGVTCVVGTDAIVPIADEMRFMVDAGMTPLEVLCAATRASAEMIDRDHCLGSLEVGKLADIVIVGGDPLLDMINMKNVRFVIQGGMVYLPDQLLPMLPAAEPPAAEDNLR
jgi:imidazolonepropionase-like amidohydrolase